VAFVAVFFSALIGMTYVFAPQVLFGYLTVASAFWLVVDHALLGPERLLCCGNDRPTSPVVVV
jgi:hypothetical protein